MIAPIRSWAVDRPISSPFATPTGLRGWLAHYFGHVERRQTATLDVFIAKMNCAP